MNYLLIENDKCVGVREYDAHVGNDNIQVITYSGNIPQERLIYVDGKVADMNNYTFINGKYVKKTKAIENLLNTNDEAKHYLNDTDWLVIRHRDQLALGQTTSLTNEQYLDLLTKRQAARERVVEYGE